jgi:hypothetical protein
MTNRLVIIDLCENDDHGNESGKVTAVHFSDSLNYDCLPVLELESTSVDDDFELEGPSCDAVGNMLLIAGQPYRFHDRRSHVGNIFWNAYVVELKDARRLARDLIQHHGFTVDAVCEEQPFLSKREAGL